MKEASSTFSLAFDFRIDSDVTLPLPEVAEIYFEVLATTTIKDHYIRGMLPLWLYGYQKGDAVMQEAAFGPLCTDGVSFVWPWFLEWLDHFRSEQLLPRSWESFADHVKDRRHGLRKERIPLLADTLWRTVWNRRAAKQHASCCGGSDDLRRVYEYVLVAGCEASESILPDKLLRLVPGDWRTYPPYFPGDRTSVQRRVQKA